MDTPDTSLSAATGTRALIDVINRLLDAAAPSVFGGTGSADPKIAGKMFGELATLPPAADAELSIAFEDVGMKWLTSCETSVLDSRTRVLAQIVSDLACKSKRGSPFLSAVVTRVAAHAHKQNSDTKAHEQRTESLESILGAVGSRQCCAVVKKSMDVDATWFQLVKVLVEMVLPRAMPGNRAVTMLHRVFRPFVAALESHLRLNVTTQPVLSVIAASIRFFRFALDTPCSGPDWAWVSQLDAIVPSHLSAPDRCLETCLQHVVTTLDSELAAALWPDTSLPCPNPELLPSYCRAFETACLFAGWGWLHDNVIAIKAWPIIRTRGSALRCSGINLCGTCVEWCRSVSRGFPPNHLPLVYTTGYVVSAGLWSIWLDPCAKSLMPSIHLLIDAVQTLQSGEFRPGSACFSLLPHLALYSEGESPAVRQAASAALKKVKQAVTDVTAQRPSTRELFAPILSKL